MKILFGVLKHQFFDWCSLLSVDECVSNDQLIRTIEQVERLLIEAAS
jgi:hypothetical protein